MKTKNSTHTSQSSLIPPFHKLSLGATVNMESVMQSKSTTPFAVDLNNLHYKELTLLAEKMKWMKRFCKAYRGLLSAETDRLYTENSKFIVACYGTHEIGFLRLTDQTGVFSAFTKEECWDITDGYIKPAYKGLGVLRTFIEHAVANEHAKSVTLAYEVAAKHADYYKALGFTVVANIFEVNCVRLFLTNWEEMLAKTCPRVPLVNE